MEAATAIALLICGSSSSGLRRDAVGLVVGRGVGVGVGAGGRVGTAVAISTGSGTSERGGSLLASACTQPKSATAARASRVNKAPRMG